MTTEHILPYANLILVLFFVTFFTDIFYQYFRYKTLVPRKMLSFRKGGLFEHYYIVLSITAVLVFLHLGFGIDPFLEVNIVSTSLSIATTYFTALVFFVFLLIFFLYIGFSLYAKIKGIADRNEYLSNQGHRIVKTAFISSFILATVFTVLAVLSL
ncbi:MAG: hypothetical protein ACOC14_02875 [Bacillota bacterium]